MQNNPHKLLAAKILSEGGVIIMPTDTVLGIAAKFDDYKACEKLYKIKKRAFDKPSALFVRDRNVIQEMAEVTPLAGELIKSFMPGGITLILHAKPEFNRDSFFCRDSKISFRIPKCPVSLELLHLIAFPLLVSSCNISSHQTPGTFDDIDSSITKSVDYIIKTDLIVYGTTPSTVIDASNNKLEIVREGIISKSALTKIIYTEA